MFAVQKLVSLLRVAPAILAASVPLCWPLQAFALGTSPYTAAATSLAGFSAAGGGFTVARGAGVFVNGTFYGSSSFAASNGARALSMGARLTAAASASAAAAIRLNPALATAGMAVWLGGLLYDYAQNRWEYGGAGAAHYYLPGYGAGQAATVAGACALHASNALAIADIYDRTCTGAISAPAPDGSGNFVNGTYGIRVTNARGQPPCTTGCFNDYVITATAQNNTATVPQYGTAGDAVSEDTWRRIEAQPLPDAVANALPGTLPLPVEAPTFEPFRTPIGSPIATPYGLKQPVEDNYPAPTSSCPTCVKVIPRTVDATDPAVGTTYQPTPAPAGEEKDTCGLPGTPPCKIDEIGTPVEADKTPTEDVDDKLVDPKRVAEGDTSLFPSWPTINWNFSLPSACGPISIPAFDPFLSAVDVCQFQPKFHDIMGVVWVLGGLFGAIGVFWRDQLAG